MALVKSIQVDIGISGAEQSKAKLDAINARAEELKTAFPEYKLKIDAAAATERLAVFRGQVKTTADAVTKPMDPVILTDKAKKSLLEIQARADELKARFPEFTIRIDDTAAKRKLAIFAAEAKATTALVDSQLASAGGGRGGLLGWLRGFASGGEGAGGGGGLLGPAGIGALAGGGLIAAGLAPGLVGAGLGGLVGVGAIGGGLAGAAEGNKVLKADTSNITQITTKLKTAIGAQKQQLSAALRDANKQYAKDSAFYAPFTAFQKSLQGLAQNFLKPLQPIMAPLSGIFTQFGKGIATLGPQFTQLFKASLPFIQQFAQVMLQAGKILLPAFTQALNQMVKSGALKEMTQGLVYLVEGFAGFVKALGPGMKASGQIFERLALAVKFAMTGIGVAVSTVARVIEFDYPKAVGKMRHDVSAAFDALRHYVVHVWDTMWNDSIGSLIRFQQDDTKLMGQLRHNIAAAFDAIRHDVASIWDTIWNNTVGRTQRGVGEVVSWFAKLPGEVEHSVQGLGTWMYNFGKNALTMIWHGAQSVVGSVTGFFSSFAHGIVSVFKKIWGWFSPSAVMYEGGRSLMEGLFLGIKDHAHKAQNLAAKTAAGITGAFSGSVLGEQRYAEGLFPRFGWSAGQLGPLIALWNRESGWNPLAMNPSSGAFGIAQALGHGLPGTGGRYGNQYPSKAANEGNAGAQIAWGLSYIAAQYGSPAAAWAHETAAGWYGSGFHGWFDKPTVIGVGERGRERVDITPGGGHGGGETVINITVNVPPTVNPRDTGRQIADLLKPYIKAGGTIFPAGVTPR